MNISIIIDIEWVIYDRKDIVQYGLLIGVFYNSIWQILN